MVERTSATVSDGISRTVGSSMRSMSRGFLNVVETMKNTSRTNRMSIIGMIATSARVRFEAVEMHGLDQAFEFGLLADVARGRQASDSSRAVSVSIRRVK